MRNFIFLLIFPFLTFSNLLFSQKNVDKYFDDGGASKANHNVIGIEVSNLYRPLIPFYYERILNKTFSVVGSIGFLKSGKKYSFWPKDDYNDIDSNGLRHVYVPKLNFVLSGEIRFWFFQTPPERSLTCLKYQYWSFKSSSFHDFTFSVGNSFKIMKNVYLVAKGGFGMRYIRYYDVAYPVGPIVIPGIYEDIYKERVNGYNIILDLHLGIGYRF